MLGLAHTLRCCSTSYEELKLSETAVTDSGLQRLTGLPGLQRLELEGDQITDAGLLHLTGLRQLQSMDLTRTEVTAEGVMLISTGTPEDCKIDYLRHLPIPESLNSPHSLPGPSIPP